MAICPKCGSTYEQGRFKCAKCGSLLTYTPVQKKPSLISKLAKYRSYFILLAVAVAIVLLQIAMVVTAAFWLIAAAIGVTVLVLWLRGRNRSMPNQGNRPVNRTPSGPPSRPTRIPVRQVPPDPKKSAKVIPFRKKSDKKPEAKQE